MGIHDDGKSTAKRLLPAERERGLRFRVPPFLFLEMGQQRQRASSSIDTPMDFSVEANRLSPFYAGAVFVDAVAGGYTDGNRVEGHEETISEQSRVLAVVVNKSKGP
jgi:hypothetical protein